MSSVSIDEPAAQVPPAEPLATVLPDAPSPDRLALARAIEARVLAVPGVVDLIGDVAGAPRGQGAGTWTARGHVAGVRVMAEDDRFSVDLAIRAELVDLMTLGEDVREAALAAAREAGFGGAVGAVSIRIADVVESAGGDA
jgi:hypothetical protein